MTASARGIEILSILNISGTPEKEKVIFKLFLTEYLNKIISWIKAPEIRNKSKTIKSVPANKIGKNISTNTKLREIKIEVNWLLNKFSPDNALFSILQTENK